MAPLECQNMQLMKCDILGELEKGYTKRMRIKTFSPAKYFLYEAFEKKFPKKCNHLSFSTVLFINLPIAMLIYFKLVPIKSLFVKDLYTEKLVRLF